jgi:hypothetical protein
MWTPNSEQIVTAAQKEAEALAAQRLADLPNLEPDQFWFVVRASGYHQELLDWIDKHKSPTIIVDGEEVDNPDYSPVFWAGASSKIEFAKFFERDHPLIEAARQALGITSEELDGLWRFGAQQ